MNPNENRSSSIRMSNIDCCLSIVSSLCTSLGPRGLDKLLVCGADVTITNDGATILEKLGYSHPISSLLVNVSKTQDVCCGDGTTSVVVLVGAFLHRCRKLLKTVHPIKIVDCMQKIKDRIDGEVEKCGYAVEGREEFIRAVVTSLSSKVVSSCARELAEISYEALKYTDSLEKIKVVKRVGGGIEETRLVKGVVLESFVKDVQISKEVNVLMVQFCLSAPKTNIDSKILVTESSAMEMLMKEEKTYIKGICKKIRDSGCELLLVQKSILRESLSPLAAHYLKKAGILVLNDIERKEFEYIAESLDIVPVSDVDLIEPLPKRINTEDPTKEASPKSPKDSNESSGESKENQTIGEDPFEKEGTPTPVFFQQKEEHGIMIATLSRKSKPTTSIIVHGSDQHITDETERSLRDALSVVRLLKDEPVLVPGGGYVETRLSLMEAEDTLTQELLRAFHSLPFHIYKNAGIPPEKILALRANKEKNTGINVKTGKIANMIKDEVVQPIAITKNMVHLAIETVMTIIKIDDILPMKQ